MTDAKEPYGVKQMAANRDGVSESLAVKLDALTDEDWAELIVLLTEGLIRKLEERGLVWANR